MREAFITNIINGFCRFYDYGVIELVDTLGLSSRWALVKILNSNSKRVIIFINNSKDFHLEDALVKLNNNLNCENIQLIKILAVDNNELNSASMNFVYEDDVVTVEYTSNKLLAYGYECEETAQEIANLMNYYDSSKNKSKSSEDKPWITYGLIVVNVIMYAITAFLSSNIFDSDINVLVFLGAKYNELIAVGEYYRLVTCMFLHGGIMHLVLNMYALNSIGPLVERVYGKVKYVIIYFVSGIISSLLSFQFSEAISIGASGAIFGLLGTTFVFAVTRRKDMGKGFLRNIASVIIINLFIGLSMPNIDNFGHLGGLIGGVITALVINLLRKKVKG
jgi:rhomboid protease GluP